jgi:hypothetical protein
VWLAKTWNLELAKFWRLEPAKFGNMLNSRFRNYNERGSSRIRDLEIMKKPSQIRHLKSPGLECQLVAGS